MVPNLHTHIAYRCHKCGTLIYGFVGRFALSTDLLRIKCTCGESALDINMTADKKVRISSPCIFCGKNHNFVVSQNIFFGREIFLLNCPYANMDICFIGTKEKIDEEALRTTEELNKVFTELGAESLGDIQPEDLAEDEVLPDPATYDAIRFLVKELEAEGKIDCPCHSGRYDLRFCDVGIKVYCEECGATHIFNTQAEAASRDYIDTDSIYLKP